MHALLFRVIGILRPAAMLVAVRGISLADAQLYAAFLSRYVIGTEVYNLLFPTDALYKSGATLPQAVALAVSRARLAIPVAGLSALVLWSLSGNWLDALAIAAAAFLSALAVPFYAYAFPRIAFRSLARLEISFHLMAAAALLLWWRSGEIWYVVGFTLLEVPLKGCVVVLMDRTALVGALRGRWKARRETGLGAETLAGLRMGFPITLANYFFRLPFALPFPSGTLDPLFLLCGQAVNSFYNIVLIAHSERISRVIQGAALASMVAGLAGVVLAAIFGLLDMSALQFLLVCAFVLPYACWLAQLPGDDGLFQKTRYRHAVVLGLGMVLLAAALAAPMLIWLAFVFPCVYFTMKKLVTSYAQC